MTFLPSEFEAAARRREEAHERYVKALEAIVDDLVASGPDSDMPPSARGHLYRYALAKARLLRPGKQRRRMPWTSMLRLVP